MDPKELREALKTLQDYKVATSAVGVIYRAAEAWLPREIEVKGWVLVRDGGTLGQYVYVTEQEAVEARYSDLWTPVLLTGTAFIKRSTDGQ
jgi:hypothetical protein